MHHLDIATRLSHHSDHAGTSSCWQPAQLLVALVHIISCNQVSLTLSGHLLIAAIHTKISQLLLTGSRSRVGNVSGNTWPHLICFVQGNNHHQEQQQRGLNGAAPEWPFHWPEAFPAGMAQFPGEPGTTAGPSPSDAGPSSSGAGPGLGQNGGPHPHMHAMPMHWQQLPGGFPGLPAGFPAGMPQMMPFQHVVRALHLFCRCRPLALIPPPLKFADGITWTSSSSRI